MMGAIIYQSEDYRKLTFLDITGTAHYNPGTFLDSSIGRAIGC